MTNPIRNHWAAFRNLPLILALITLPCVAREDANALSEQAQSAFAKGGFSEAAAQWEKALNAYREAGNLGNVIDTSLSLASAYQAIGQNRRAVEVLEEALKSAEKFGDRSRLAVVKSKLGAALGMSQQFDRAAPLLQEALEAAKQAGDSQLEGSVLNDQGNLLAAQEKYAEASAAFEESLALARKNSNAWLTANAVCNAALAAAKAGESEKADRLNAQALEAIEHLEGSHAKAFLLLTAAQTDRQIVAPASSNRLLLRAHQSILGSLALAETLKDGPVETYALGYLGQLYEQDGQLVAALDLTRRAAFVAQQEQMPEALYRWEWQTGRLLRSQGEIDAATAAYRRAIQTLQPIRSDVSLGAGNAASRRSFRESQGPLFFELADLLLDQSKTASDPNKEQELLLEARDTVEQMKAVELEDYFCDECVNALRAKTRTIEALDGHTAVIYLIPLPKRTEVLVGLESGLKRFTVEVGAEALAAQVRQFRRNLETRTTYAYLEQAQQLYDWLLRPATDLLKEHQINTLVFVPDGALRTIPFSTLHNGERFLIQDYAVAVAPGLSLVASRPMEREKSRLLLSGVSEGVQGYPPLEFVPSELQGIQPLYQGEKLLDRGFTLEELKRRLAEEQFSIVHIASHGQFDHDARKTFVLTHDTKLTLNDLESLIRPAQYRGHPIELLVLSACQTAAGDDRAALGLAGVAVKAGARSALATLWFVNDQSTSMVITEMYSQMRADSTISKARALQAAQIKLLGDRRYRHPCYWSPYLIIGNWL